MPAQVRTRYCGHEPFVYPIRCAWLGLTACCISSWMLHIWIDSYWLDASGPLDWGILYERRMWGDLKEVKPNHGPYTAVLLMAMLHTTGANLSPALKLMVPTPLYCRWQPMPSMLHTAAMHVQESVFSYTRVHELMVPTPPYCQWQPVPSMLHTASMHVHEGLFTYTRVCV